MGRMVSVMLSEKEADFLEEYCTYHRLSKSDAIRLALKLLSSSESKGTILTKAKYRRITIRASHVKTVSISPLDIIIEGEDLHIESAI